MKVEEYEAAIEFAYGKKPAEIESFEAAKTDFQTRTVLRSEAVKDDAIVGAILGPLDTKVKKLFGEDLGGEDSESRLKYVKAPNFTAKLDVLAEITKGNREKAINDFKAGYTAKPDERVKALETENLGLKTKFEQTEAARLAALDTAKKWENDHLGYVRQDKIEKIKSKIARDVPMVLDHIPENTRKYTVQGFENDFNSKYKLDLNEDETDVIVLDAKTGARVGNPAINGAYLGLKDVLSNEIKAAGFDQKSPVQGRKTQFNNQNQFEPQNRNADKPGKVRKPTWMA